MITAHRCLWRLGGSVLFLLVGTALGASDLAPVIAPLQQTGPARSEPQTLPRVLLIGDSICQGYTPTVQQQLAGRARVERIPENGGDTTNGLAHLAQWLGSNRWDIIHFNWGLHDLKIRPDGARQVSTNDFARQLRTLTRHLRATGARLMWASTTPVPATAARLQPPRAAADVPVYNAIAQQIMREYRVPVNDLNTFATPQLAAIQKPDDVHYTPAGYEILGHRVAEKIAGLLTNIMVDAQGVICVEAEHFVRTEGWTGAAGYAGTGVVVRAESATPNFVDYLVHIPHPQEYRVHVLGNRRRNTAVADNVLAVEIAPEGEPLHRAAALQFNDLNATSWTSISAGRTTPPTVHFAAPGLHRVRLTAARGQGFFVDKIVLSATEYVPRAAGPEATWTGDYPVDLGGFDPLVVLPPAWAFGVLYGGYTDQTQSLATVHQLRAAGFPVDAYWIDSWFWDFANKGVGPGGYLNFVPDPLAFPNPKAMWDEFQSLHIKSGVWLWDCILREGNEPTFEEFRAARAFANIYIETGGWHNRTRMTICGNLDFTQPEVVALWRQKLAPLFEQGLDFLKIDRSSALPFTKAAFEASQELGRDTGGRGFVLAHLQTAYDPRHKLYPTRWSGDAKIAWTQPDYPDNSIYAMGALRENIGMVADPKRTTYNVPFFTHDGGGYAFFGSKDFGDELYVRWMQFAALNAITTAFSHPENPTRNHPIHFAPTVQTIVRKYLQLRLRLFPYLYTHALNTRLTGNKMIQGDGQHADQYLLGGDLLVAPVHHPGQTNREVFLPPGQWIDWDNGEKLTGPGRITVAAPLEKLPLFVRAGAMIPLREYAPAVELGSNQKLALEIFPAPAPSRFVLHEDDGRSNAYLDGQIASTSFQLEPAAGQLTLKIGAVTGTYASMSASREWIARFHLTPPPARATVNGAPVPATYDAVTRTATVTFTTPRATETIVILE